MSDARKGSIVFDCLDNERNGILVTVAVTALILAAVQVSITAGTDTLLAVRLTWTLVTFIGTVRVALNLRQAVLDLAAVLISSKEKDGARILQAQGAVFDQGLKTIALGADCLAGVMALANWLMPTVVLLCVGALMLVNLSFAQERRRKRTLAILDVLYNSQLDSIQITVEDTNQQVTDMRAKTVTKDESNRARMQAIEDNASTVAETLAQKESADLDAHRHEAADLRENPVHTEAIDPNA